jgi:hypothetical protein
VPTHGTRANKRKVDSRVAEHGAVAARGDIHAAVIVAITAQHHTERETTEQIMAEVRSARNCRQHPNESQQAQAYEARTTPPAAEHTTDRPVRNGNAIARAVEPLVVLVIVCVNEVKRKTHATRTK